MPLSYTLSPTFETSFYVYIFIYLLVYFMLCPPESPLVREPSRHARFPAWLPLSVLEAHFALSVFVHVVL